MYRLRTAFFPRPILSAASPRPRTRAKRAAIRLEGKRRGYSGQSIDRLITAGGVLCCNHALASMNTLSPRHRATLEPLRKKKCDASGVERIYARRSTYSATRDFNQRDLADSRPLTITLPSSSVAQPQRVGPRYYPHRVEYRLSIAAPRRRTLPTRVVVGFTRPCGRPLFLHASVSLARFRRAIHG